MAVLWLVRLLLQVLLRLLVLMTLRMPSQRALSRHQGAAYPNAWPVGPAAAAAGDPLNTRTYSTCSTVGAVAAAAGSATVPSHLVGAMRTVAAVACPSTLGKLVPGKSDMVHADENSPSSLRRPVIIL